MLRAEHFRVNWHGTQVTIRTACAGSCSSLSQSDRTSLSRRVYHPQLAPSSGTHPHTRSKIHKIPIETKTTHVETRTRLLPGHLLQDRCAMKPWKGIVAKGIVDDDKTKRRRWWRILNKRSSNPACEGFESQNNAIVMEDYSIFIKRKRVIFIDHN